MIKVFPISAFQDNYIWCYTNLDTKTAIIVDPGKAAPVLEFLSAQSLQLAAIFITHHHADHTGGVEALISTLSSKTNPIPVYGPAKESIPCLTNPLQEGDSISLPNFPTFTVLDIPCHTRGHIAYVGGGVLFSGDTLFCAGCGRLFEGTAEDMLNSLTKLSKLPPETLVYCGHEYTQKNLSFALTIEPDNSDIKQRYTQVCELRARLQPTVPAPLSLELKTNPFLRTAIPTVIEAASRRQQKNLKTLTQVDVFAALRQWKDQY